MSNIREIFSNLERTEAY